MKELDRQEYKRTQEQLLIAFKDYKPKGNEHIVAMLKKNERTR